MLFLGLQPLVVLLSAAVFRTVNRVVPEPYLDEIFHITQSQKYCNGMYREWDPKITTPPGLYILALAYDRILHLSCSVAALRSFNIVGVLVFMPLVLSMMKSGYERRQRLSSLACISIELVPPFFFFAFLFYTDVWSTISVLVIIAMAENSGTSSSWLYVPLKITLGILSISLRQTNIVWVAYACGIELLSNIVGGDQKGKQKADETFIAANLPMVLLRVLVAYGTTIALFVAFVIYNGSILLGDKEHHEAGIHIPQLFYFSVFSCILGVFSLIPSIKLVTGSFSDTLFRTSKGFFYFFISSLLVVVAIKYTTKVHPFLLADNRHYTFYIWRRILNFRPWIRYLYAPGYVLSMWIVFVHSYQLASVLKALLFAGATAAVLVPSPLIECRYFIIPFVIWKLQLLSENKAASETDGQRSLMISASSLRKAQWAEVLYYILINALTIGLFLGYSFEWPNEPGQKQRFMWMMNPFNNLTNNINMDSVNQSLRGLTSTISPFARRTGRLIQERLGNADEITELPQEYIDLEKRVDALKTVHTKLLSVTSQYGHEGYDYPPNLKESFADISRQVSERVQTLAQAQSAAEAQAALLKGNTSKNAPKTFAHAISRAALAAAHQLPITDPVGVALEKYAVAQERVGEAQLAQDSLIVSRFNSALQTSLNTSFKFADRARKNVTNARLSLDAAKTSARNAKPERQDALRVEVEQAEDEFVAATEEAVSVMKNVLETPELLRNLADLIAAQLAFHKAAYEMLSELAPEIDQLQADHESKYSEAETS
ncbi:DIE2/ALG10 family-domain-containing protein [Dipodascopsis uninucleata]